MPACLALSALCSLSLCNCSAVPHLTLEGALDWIPSMIIRVLEKEKTLAWLEDTERANSCSICLVMESGWWS